MSRSAVSEVIDWWRHANESPGGCSPRAALDGMADAVWRLHQTLIAAEQAAQIDGSGDAA